MSAFINKMLNLVGFDNDDDQLMDEEENNVFATNKYQESARETNSKRNTGKLVSLSNANQLKLVVMQPSAYEEAQDICDHLKEKKPVVINLEYADKVTATKLIDFLSGAVYAIDGHIEKVSPTIFLIVPNNVDVLTEGKEDKSKGTFAWIK